MTNKTKTNLLVDGISFFGFLAMSNPSLTGLPIHEWLGISFIAVLVTHLVLHWDWVVNMTKTFFNKLIHESRLNYVVNALLFVAFTAVMFSGILISRNVMEFFGIQISASPAWRSIHSLSANLTLLFTGLHFALHWRWIVTNVSRYIVSPVTGLFKQPVSRPLAVQPVEVENRK